MKRMTSTSKSAVSDYEHLKYRFGNENQIWANESEDEEFLPLKSKSKRIGGRYEGALTSDSSGKECVTLSSIDTEENGLGSIKKVPVPLEWSPGMIVKPNPSLFITPEKASKDTEKDNILEPRDLNKVPTPIAWIPHSELRPTVFITPEKKSVNSFKPAIQTTDTAKLKEKLSVRFDLPSSSSADELLDSSAFSDADSPITIKRKDLVERDSEIINSLCPSKVYNPVVYSDDSFLDDSFPGNKGIDGTSAVSLSTSANLVEKLNQLLNNSEIQEDSKLPTKSATCTTARHKDASNGHSISSSLKTKEYIAPQHSSFEKVVSSSNVDVKKSASVPGKKSFKKLPHNSNATQTKSGPHHLSSSTVSPYYPPNSGACVVRETKHPLISTDYSYPFQNADDNQKHEHIFSRPEFNSTLKVRSELDNLCDQDVDVDKAVGAELSKSSAKRTEIQEKAAVFTNQLSDQFTNLVDLEPSVDRLCDRVVRMRTCKATSQKKGSKQHKKASNLKEPDLMEFYHSDLQKESPDLGLLSVSLAVPDLMGAPHDQAFDCYRHYRVWNGLRDF